MLKKEILIKFAVAGAVLVLPLNSWSQEEGGLTPGRLGIGDAGRDGDVKLTGKGELLPGDIPSSLPEITPLPDGSLPVPPEDRRKSLSLLPESVRKMEGHKQEEIRTLLDEAANFIQGIRLQEGLERLIRIEELTKDFYATYNLRGAIYTKLRDFGKARAAFRKALELEPELVEAMFNLAELDFVEQKFSEAEKAFQELKERYSSRFSLYHDTGKLIDYKLFISTLRQSTAPGDSKEREALAMLDEYDFHLMSVASPHELSDTGQSLVIVALIGGDKLHIRIFDRGGQRVVDKAEAELVRGQDLTDLKELLFKIPFPEGSILSDNDLKKLLNEIQFPDDPTLSDKRTIVNQATAISGYTHFDYLDDYPGYYYSQAALAFHQGRNQEAEEWMASASRIYSKPMQTIYIDALIEMGWVQAL